ncbi:hypothetical protein SEPCBS119000_002685 [Sporothrix epigloea]|uniref:Serine aminopeptidase S33 domain-containing protein n=1 Tax=Sporothrix epigloea TaxID=1892477 RepID=A0ABP0DJ93_9PEZI
MARYTLGRVARQLVECSGCRVMLFDLFGRGFSDGVADLPHDARLYCSQMLCALASSPLPWTGDSAFDLIGYSMGGGVAVHFATAFPNMLRSLVLLAPAGLIRPERFGVAARLIFTSGIVPERLLANVTRRRLRRPLASGLKAKQQQLTAAEKGLTLPEPSMERESRGLEKAVAEAMDTHSAAVEAQPPEPLGVLWSMQVGRYVRWMLSHHDGFVPAFMSCIRDAPLVGQDEAWARLAELARGSSDKGQRKLPLCIVLGRQDDVVDTGDYEKDVLPLFGGLESGDVVWSLVPGGHDFPMTYSRHVLRTIFGFWGDSDDALTSLQAEETREAAISSSTGKLHHSTTASRKDADRNISSGCKPVVVESMQ